MVTPALSLAVEDEYIYTKIVTFASKYVFNNKTEFTLLIIQTHCSDIETLSLEPGQCSPFHWPNSQSEKSIQIRLANYKEKRPLVIGGVPFELDWSVPFTLNELGAITVKCQGKTLISNCRFLKVDKVQVCGTIAVNVEIENLFSQYLIKNLSRNFSLAYWQKEKHLDKCYLDSMKEVPFTWSDNSLPKIIQLQFYYGTFKHHPLIFQSGKAYDFCFDKLGITDKIIIKTTQKKGHILFVTTISEGYSKVLQITDVEPECDISKKEEEAKSNYLLKVYIAHIKNI